ncbi:MAG TPA: dihydroorotate dehydrogenase-like protein [Leptolyngbyaceae cyanobacterium]
MDLTTTYMGLTLRSPLVPSAAAPLTENIDNVKRMEDAGAGAVVLHSLFEEQIRKERYELHHHLTYGTESFPEALTYFPEPEIFHVGTEEYLNHIRRAKEMVNIPIFASLNGTTVGGWIEYAKQMEQAGADGLELNIYNVPTDMEMSGAQVEQNYIDIVCAVRSQVKIPVAVKLSPYFSNMANMAKRLQESGANALVCFNRFYQPDIDIEELEVRPNIILSAPQDMRLPMRWIAILYGRLNLDLAATSGVHKGNEAIKMLMAGAKISQICSVLLRHGIDHIRVIEREMVEWMEQNDYHSVQQMIGSMSQINCPDESAFERAQYLKSVQTYRPLHSIFSS